MIFLENDSVNLNTSLEIYNLRVKEEWLEENANKVAHCGSWHRITSTPFRTPCCGAELFNKTTQNFKGK